MSRNVSLCLFIGLVTGCVSSSSSLKQRFERNAKVGVYFDDDKRVDRVEDMIYQHLLDHSFSVFERKQIKDVRKEQELGEGVEGAVEAAKVLKADYLVIPAVQEMIESHLPLIGSPFPPPELVMSARIVDVKSSEILGVARSRASLNGLQTTHQVLSYLTLYIWSFTFQPIINGLFAPSKETLFDWTVSDLIAEFREGR